MRVAISILVCLPLKTHAEIVISEIYYDAPGTDAKQEWIELHNTGATPIDLTKWKINDGSNHTFNAPPKNGSTGSLVLTSGAYMILAADARTFRANNTTAVSVIDTTLSLANDGETVTLLDASSSVAATASYTKSDGAAGDGNSLQRNSSAWIASLPTPGRTNATVATVGPFAKAPPGPKAAKAKSAGVAKASSVSVGTNSKLSKYAAPVTGESDINTGASDSEAPVSNYRAAQTASALPANSPWTWGITGLALMVAGGVYAARTYRKDEWDIKEI